jgi:RNA 2',3'-cyclic 3'-phosphodiesterase
VTGSARDSVFFAIRPDEGALADIEQCRGKLCAAHGLRGKPISADRLHITLHFLGEIGDLPENVVAQAIDVARLVRAAPFEVTLDRVMTFYSSKKTQFPVILGSTRSSPELVAFQKNLGAMLKQAGMDNKLRGFTPHLTLLYDEHGVKEQPASPVHWSVREFLLVHSFYGRGRHDVLGRWILAQG